tara:strand:- start:35 stop:844 length:810 start_codon:yes stop_codon:yes gene_type:complete
MPTVTIHLNKLGKILNLKQNLIQQKRVKSINTDNEVVSVFTEAAEEIKESVEVVVQTVEPIKNNDTNMQIVFPENVLLDLFFNTPTNYMADLYMSSLQKFFPEHFDKVDQEIQEVVNIVGFVDKNSFIHRKIFNIIKDAFDFAIQDPKMQLKVNEFIFDKFLKFTPKLTLFVTDSTGTDICGKEDFTTKFSKKELSPFDNTTVKALGNDALDSSSPGLSNGEYYKMFFLFERYFPLSLEFQTGAQVGQFGNLYVHVVSKARPGKGQLKI